MTRCRQFTRGACAVMCSDCEGRDFGPGAPPEGRFTNDPHDHVHDADAYGIPDVVLTNGDHVVFKFSLHDDGAAIRLGNPQVTAYSAALHQEFHMRKNTDHRDLPTRIFTKLFVLATLSPEAAAEWPRWFRRAFIIGFPVTWPLSIALACAACIYWLTYSICVTTLGALHGLWTGK